VSERSALVLRRGAALPAGLEDAVIAEDDEDRSG
jgi:hypothetical protein